MARIDRFTETMAIAVAAGSSIKDAAIAAGASERQGYRVAASSRFRELVAKLRSNATDRAVGLLSDRAAKAVDVLSELMDSRHASVRLAAASKVLAMLPKIAEHAELRSRVDQLENR